VAYSQLGSSTDGVGMTWSKLNDPGNGMITVWIILLAEWPVFMLLPLLMRRVRGDVKDDFTLDPCL
jgi:hypothetical protein